MEDSADLNDWELVHGSDLIDNHAGVVILDEDTTSGAVKDDYFAFDFGSSQHLQSDVDSDEGGIDSDNPSCADPDSDSHAFLETSGEHLGFIGMTFPMRNSGGFVSDESSEGQRSLVNSENVGPGSSEGSVMEMGSEESDSSDSRELTEIGADASINEGVKKEKIWWKVPLGLLKYCLVGMRPIWSVSIAAAVVGIVMLWRKLYRMKRRSRGIPLKLAIEDKKASQFVNMPIIRSSLQAAVATQWAVLPLR